MTKRYTPTDWQNEIKDADGTVVQKGTPLSAENMNKIEKKLVSLDGVQHSHGNQDVLDNITQQQINQIHEHPNKAVLDSIKAENIHNHSNKALLDQVKQSHLDNSHTHVNKELLDSIKLENVHLHDNKAILDTVTQDHLDKAHSHSNKALLDTIKPENVHEHGNKVILDAVTQTHLNNSHNHNNKAVLDKLSQAHFDEIEQHGQTLTDHETRIVNLLERITNLKIKVVQTIAERDALTNKESIIVHVVDASADSSVKNGWAQYIYQSNDWIKIAENESIDVILTWADIINKPTTFPPSAHTHQIANVDGLQQALNDRETITGATEKVNAHANLKTNPHGVTKSQVGLGNVENVQQATKAEFNTHNTDGVRHITAAERKAWNEKAGGAHTHGWDEITGKPAIYPPSAHKHTEADIIDLDKYTQAEVDAKLSGKAATSHTHEIAQVSGLQEELNNKFNKAGDTMTGPLTIQDSTISPDSITFDGRTAAGMKVSNSNGYVSIAPLNTSGAHIYTDRALFFFNKTPVAILNAFSSYANDLLLQRQYVTKLTLGATLATFANQVKAPSFIQTDGKLIETTDGANTKVHSHAADDVLHISAAERKAWNEKSNFSGSYTDLTNKPSQFPPSAHTHDYSTLTNKPAIPDRTSELTNDSGFVQSNAGKITVSATAPINPKTNDIWIVI